MESGDAIIGTDETISLVLPVPGICDGWRLDHFLKHRIGRLSRTRIQTIIAQQITFADGRRVRASTRVRRGEIIHLDRPAPAEPEVPRYFDIVYEAPTFFVLEKPAGLPIHTTAKFWRNTLTALLRERYPDQRVQVCHRLDRETSGLLLVARDVKTASSLKTAFAKRRVDKSYLALVHGIPPESGAIDLPLCLLDTRTRIMMGVAKAQTGLPSRSVYRVLRTGPRHALVLVSPETGRQHQIRVHLAAIGHPIVGDKMYGAGEDAFVEYCDGGMTPALLERFDGLPRQALHAHQLTFPHPETGTPVRVESPWPADLAAYIEKNRILD